MKSLEISLSLLEETGRALGINTTRDAVTVARRTEEEGLSFLTITLPSLEKQLLSAVAQGWCDSNSWPFFKVRKGIPVFLQGFLRRIFPYYRSGKRHLSEDKVLVAETLRGLRQVLAVHGKQHVMCSPSRERLAKLSYVETDRGITGNYHRDVPHVFWDLFGSALLRVEARLFNEPFPLRHGPGAVSEKLTANQKWTLPVWTEKLQTVLPWWELRPPRWQETGEGPEFKEVYSRLVSVPKTQKAPRLIAVEPTSNQLVQQGLLMLLEEELRKTSAWRLMGWTDQDRNRGLAKEASKLGQLATLDLSEASDRLSLDLVRACLSKAPYLLKWVEACRTDSILTDDGLIELRKFASMGSALTFPLESMVFTACALVGMFGDDCRHRDPSYLEGLLSVYGDDIIVPVDTVPRVIEVLESSDFKVNRSKSFWTGLFRESCGADYYGGIPVNLVRNRSDFEARCTPTDLETRLSFRNQLYTAGYYRTCDLLDQDFSDIPRIPVGEPSCGVWTYDDEKIRWRWDNRLHRPVFRTIRIRRKLPADILDGFAALTKFFAHKEVSDLPLQEGHDVRAGRPRSGEKKYGWTAVSR